MKNIIFAICIILISLSSLSQEILLLKSDKKTKRLSSTNYLLISLKDSILPDSSIQYITYGGYFSKIKKNKIELDIDFYQKEKTNYSNFCSIIETKEKIECSLDKTSINKDNIHLIVHERKSGKVFNIIGASALIGALVLSPLASINYTNGQVDSNNYLSLTSYFLSTAIISYSCAFVFGEKKFYFSPFGNKRKWKIIN